MKLLLSLIIITILPLSCMERPRTEEPPFKYHGLESSLKNLKTRVLHSGNILFHGPSGTGRTTVVQMLGEELGRKVYILDGKAFVSQNAPTEELKHFFSTLRNANESVLVLVKNVDALALPLSNSSDKKIVEACEVLLAEAKLCDDDITRKVCIIGTASQVNILNTVYISHIIGNAIKFDLPNDVVRKQFLTFYLNLKNKSLNKANLNIDQDKLLNYLVSETKECNLNDLQAIINNAATLAIGSKAQIIGEEHCKEALATIKQLKPFISSRRGALIIFMVISGHEIVRFLFSGGKVSFNIVKIVEAFRRIMKRKRDEKK